MSKEEILQAVSEANNFDSFFRMTRYIVNRVPLASESEFLKKVIGDCIDLALQEPKGRLSGKTIGVLNYDKSENKFSLTPNEEPKEEYLTVDYFLENDWKESRFDYTKGDVMLLKYGVPLWFELWYKGKAVRKVKAMLSDVNEALESVGAPIIKI